MIDLNLARKYRDVRHAADVEQRRQTLLPSRIASRLSGINFDDMTPTEKQIADLLGREGHLFFNDLGECKVL